jgi:hypothetical protein
VKKGKEKREKERTGEKEEIGRRGKKKEKNRSNCLQSRKHRLFKDRH